MTAELQLPVLRYHPSSGPPGDRGTGSISAADLTHSDERLLERVSEGDTVAFERLYDRYSRVVFSQLLRTTRQQAVAEELTQEVFMRVWRRASSFDSERGRLGPWLLAVARNLALDRVRSKAERQRAGEQELSELTAAKAAAPQSAAWVEQRALAHQARSFLAGLPEDQRRAIELAYFEGLSQSEIADQLGTPVGTVKSWIRKGLLRLRDEMEGGAV